LEEVAEIVGGGTPSTDNYDYWGGDISWLTPRDLSVTEERFVSHGERNITQLGLENSSAKLLPAGTVLLTTRAPIGYLAIASNQICTNQGFKSLIPDSQMVDSVFLYYLLKNNVDYLKSVGVGTTFAEISGGALRQIEFSFPELSVQHQIAEILSMFDDKIELNRQTNATLEAIAQAIFKEWFVDFNYPGATGELVDTPLGPIPKGWRVGTVGDAVKRVPAGKVYDFKSSLPTGIVPILDQSHFTVIGYHNEPPGVSASIEKPVIVFSNHRCYTDLIQFPFSAIQNVLPFVGDQADTRWLYNATDGIITYSEYKGHWPEFVSKPLLIPPLNVTRMYGELVKPAQVLKLENLRESQLLAKLRDALLPKLMSGKIEV
jgi:type I restriction enzyme S subunit